MWLGIEEPLTQNPMLYHSTPHEVLLAEFSIDQVNRYCLTKISDQELPQILHFFSTQNPFEELSWIYSWIQAAEYDHIRNLHRKMRLTRAGYNLAASNAFNTAFKVIESIGAGFSADALSDFDNRFGASLLFQGPCGCVDGFVRELVNYEFHGSHFHPKVETLEWFVKNQGCLVYKYRDNWERLALIVVSSSVVDFTPLQHLVKRTEFADNARLVW